MSNYNIMSKQKKIFIQRLFQILASKEYLLLKYVGNSLSELEEQSDLDILLPNAKDIDEVMAFVEQETNVLQYDLRCQSSMLQVFVYFNDGGFLQVDFLYKLIRKYTIYLPNKYLLNNIQSLSDGTRTYNLNCLLEHLILFHVLNGAGMPPKYVHFFETLPTNTQTNLLAFFNKKYHTKVLSFNNLMQYDAKVHEQLKKYINTIEQNSTWHKVKNGFKYFKDVLGLLKQAKATVISFSGVDGAGKSTLLEETKRVLQNKYRQKVVVLRHRPSVLPILSAWRHGKKKAEQRAAATLPRQGANKSKWGSMMRFAYYYTDYVFGQFYVWARYSLRNYVVIYDRYYFDFIVDAKRSNIAGNSSWIKPLYKLVHKPDVNILLYAKPETILQRKQELNASTIKILTTKYVNLFKELAQKNKNKQYVAIENVHKEDTLQTIVAAYLKSLASTKKKMLAKTEKIIWSVNA